MFVGDAKHVSKIILTMYAQAPMKNFKNCNMQYECNIPVLKTSLSRFSWLCGMF